eukprot:145412-Chlamydomonas_euryale.AAC.3
MLCNLFPVCSQQPGSAVDPGVGVLFAMTMIWRQKMWKLVHREKTVWQKQCGRRGYHRRAAHDLGVGRGGRLFGVWWWALQTAIASVEKRGASERVRLRVIGSGPQSRGGGRAADGRVPWHCGHQPGVTAGAADSAGRAAATAGGGGRSGCHPARRGAAAAGAGAKCELCRPAHSCRCGRELAYRREGGQGGGVEGGEGGCCPAGLEVFTEAEAAGDGVVEWGGGPAWSCSGVPFVTDADVVNAFLHGCMMRASSAGRDPKCGLRASSAGSDPKYGLRAASAGRDPKCGLRAASAGRDLKCGLRAASAGRDPKCGLRAASAGRDP